MCSLTFYDRINRSFVILHILHIQRSNVFTFTSIGYNKLFMWFECMRIFHFRVFYNSLKQKLQMIRIYKTDLLTVIGWFAKSKTSKVSEHFIKI